MTLLWLSMRMHWCQYEVSLCCYIIFTIQNKINLLSCIHSRTRRAGETFASSVPPNPKPSLDGKGKVKKIDEPEPANKPKANTGSFPCICGLLALARSLARSLGDSLRQVIKLKPSTREIPTSKLTGFRPDLPIQYAFRSFDCVPTSAVSLSLAISSVLLSLSMPCSGMCVTVTGTL